ncbi:hypothetical protein MRX96_020512 [Rhipicephalus microplus]
MLWMVRNLSSTPLQLDGDRDEQSHAIGPIDGIDVRAHLEQHLHDHRLVSERSRMYSSVSVIVLGID